MKQLNNKLLIGILAALACIFIIAKVFRSPKRESNINNVFAGIDTATITEIKIYPAFEKHQEIKLVREGTVWKAQRETVNTQAATPLIKELLQSVSTIQVQQLLTKKRDKWNDYNIGDSSGTHVIIYKQQEQIADWWLSQSKDGSSTFIRTVKEDNVYSISGLANGIVNKPFNDWRNKTFLRIDPAMVNKISFQYPADSSFVLSKKEKLWTVDSQPADSTAVQNYFNKVSFNDMATFVDDFSPAEKQPDVVIQFKKDNNAVASVKAWKRETDWVLTSFYQPNVYFSSNGSIIATDLFVDKNTFLSANKSQ